MRVALARAFVAIGFLLASAAAGAAPQLPEVTAAARPTRALDMNLNVPLEEHVCPSASEPDPWRDPSNPEFFATGPTARLDEQEMAAGSLVSLVSLRWVGPLRLNFLGVPLGSGLHFANAGWHVRWPFC